MTDERVAADAEIEVLESDVRLSRSLIWRLQEEYFSTRGIDAWKTVPFHATSSAFVCDSYADMVAAFLLDYAPHLDRQAPLWLLELGAGTGCFGWRFLRALRRRVTSYRTLADLDLRYVMTDFTPKIVDAWRDNPSLKPLLDEGCLDLAVFRPEEASSVDLLLSGRKLSRGDFRNPAIVIANYVFDTMRHDAFLLERGELYEVRYRFFREVSPAVGHVPLALDQLKCETSLAPLAAEPYYDEPCWNALLERYRAELGEASLIVPLGGLETVRRLRRLTGDAFALYVLDKGFAEAAMMNGPWAQEWVVHGSVSFMVNFDALGDYVERAGGQVLRGGGNGPDLTVTMNAIVPKRVALEHSLRFFETLRQKDPFNALNQLHRPLAPARGGATGADAINTALAVLQTCSCDPHVFSVCAPHLEAGLAAMDGSQTAALGCCLDRVRDNLYLTDRTPEVLGPLARLYYHLGEFDASLAIGELYLASLPAEASVLGYIALCHEARGRLDVALGYLRRYRELAPGEPWLKDALNRVRHRLLTESRSEQG